MQTNFVDIGPVNKAMNMLVCWLDGREHPDDSEVNVQLTTSHLVNVNTILQFGEELMYQF